MSLTRKFLAALGIEQDKIDEIISAHTETIDAIKSERDALKESAVKVTELQEELDKANTTIKELKKDESYKVKYDAIKEEFETFKTDTINKENREKKQNAFIEVLKSAGVSEKRIDSILKVSKDNIDGIEFNENGSIKNKETIESDIKTEWADFIVTTTEKGANISNPPAQNSNSVKLEDMSMEDYVKARKNK